MNDTIKTIATHSGEFHTDDIFSIALLSLVYPAAQVIRTRDEEELLNSDLVVDVGGVYDHTLKRYDYHQIGYKEMHENGALRCGFGLIWKHYGSLFTTSDYVTHRIDDTFVTTIDALDNGQTIVEKYKIPTTIHTVSSYFENFNPIDKNASMADYDKNFFIAVDSAKEYLKRLKAKYLNEEQDSNKFIKQYDMSSDKRYAVLDANMDYEYSAMRNNELLYVVSPREDGSWGALAISKSAIEPFNIRKPFPAAWRGKRGTKLSEITGIEDAIFCHITGFIAIARTKESCAELVKKSLSA